MDESSKQDTAQHVGAGGPVAGWIGWTDGVVRGLPPSAPARHAISPWRVRVRSRANWLTAFAFGRVPWPATITVAALILSWLGAFAWARPLMLPDEGRYVSVAWEMLRSGDWLTPTLNGLPYFHKPPLFYWITAAAASVFGLNDWAARAAPLIGAASAAIAVYLFVQRWWGDRLARSALVALLSQPLFYLGSQFANLDMLVAGCITVTIVLLAHVVLSVQQELPFRPALAGAYAVAGLGVLAKGLIGVVIPALVIGTWLLLLRRWRPLKALLWVPGVLLLFGIAAPWFVVMELRYPAFFDYFFVVHHFKRYAEGGFNNVEPFWFYLALLFVFALPWLPWLRAQFAPGRTADLRDHELRVLMGVWIVTITAFFSVPQSKLVGYILPVVPPLAILAAAGFESYRQSRAHASRWWWGAAAAMSALSVLVVAVLSVHPVGSTREIAFQLREQRLAGEPVYMLGNYYFDLPVYARLAEPVRVVEDWAAPEIQKRDNWRKEVADAGTFAPRRAIRLLVTPEDFPSSVCGSSVSWVIGAPSQSQRFSFLAQARAVSTVRGTTLWRVETTTPKLANMLSCRGAANNVSVVQMTTAPRAQPEPRRATAASATSGSRERAGLAGSDQ